MFEGGGTTPVVTEGEEVGADETNLYSQGFNIGTASVNPSVETYRLDSSPIGEPRANLSRN